MTRNILLAFLVPVWIVFAVIIGWFVAVFLFERLLGSGGFIDGIHSNFCFGSIQTSTTSTIKLKRTMKPA